MKQQLLQGSSSAASKPHSISLVTMTGHHGLAADKATNSDSLKLQLVT
jgi:hypothetical protein